MITRWLFAGLFVAFAPGVGATPPAAPANLFPAQSWLPPPPPPPKPPPPQAPPLPFKYLGQLQDGRDIVLFLDHGAQTLLARVGDTLDGRYRIDAINPRQATFTYLPLNQTQTLTLRTRP